jgi:hypothetical protein
VKPVKPMKLAPAAAKTFRRQLLDSELWILDSL